MIKKILITLIGTISLFGLELSNINDTNITKPSLQVEESFTKVFGHNLFNGSFSNSAQHQYNPQYLINIGDTVNIKLWGAFELEMQTIVDSQGNVFLPRVGTIHILGIKNNNLSRTIENSVKKVFKNNVFVYADLANYQPVSIFVTGAVNKPGLYEGLSSDSVIQYIDKAKGITAETGSYRSITVLRHNKKVKIFDLYEFLLHGSLEIFQFHMGDVIVINSVKNYLEIEGDVKRPYRYEMLKDKITVSELIDIVLPNPSATNFTVTRYSQNNEQTIQIYSLKDNSDLLVNGGDIINFIPDHTAQNIGIKITGEHSNIHNMIVKKGTNLQDIFHHINMSKLSEAKAFQLYRISIAEQQRSLLESQLKDLEAKALTAGSDTTDEAIIRQQEAALVMNFIQRAREVELKGKVVINENTDLSEVLLEEGDEIFIPKKSHMVIVQGEVMLPGAQTYVKGMSFDDYINSCGGFSFKADEENVLIIRKNGQVINYSSSVFNSDENIYPGDAILVLSKVDSKHLNIIKDITQILYQIAVGAAVVLRY